jgi:hypothetical protein
MASSKKIEPGDRVTVPWGLDEVAGIAVQIYGPPGRRHVVVRVPVMGSTGETLEETELSFPESAVKRAA